MAIRQSAVLLLYYTVNDVLSTLPASDVPWKEACVMKTVSWFCVHCGAANEDEGSRCFAFQRVQEDDEGKAVEFEIRNSGAALLRGRYRLLRNYYAPESD